MRSETGTILDKIRSGEIYRTCFIGFVLVVSLRTFQFFPGGRPLEEIWILICFLGFAILYPLLKIQSDWSFQPIELYLLCMLPLFIVLPGIAAQREFGQPVIYGILARRSMLLITPWLLMIEVWRRGWVRSQEIEKILLFMAWGTSFLYISMQLLLNPANFPNAPAGFLRGQGTSDVAFSEPGCFMIFGTIYYALLAIRERRTRPTLYAIYFFVNAIGTSGRFLTVTFFVTVGYFLTRWRKLGAVISITIRALAGVAVLAGLVFLVNPKLLQEKVGRFGDAFVAVTGQQVDDPSAYARVVETGIALPYIKRHPLIGNGLHSTQWEDGAGAVGEYFFPDDIGLVGVVFDYGALGLVLFGLQYLFSLRAAFRLPPQLHSPLLDACKGYLVYTAIYSLTTGSFVFAFEQSSFFVVLMIVATNELRYSSAAPLPAFESTKHLALT